LGALGLALSVAPFVLLLASIALLPLVAPRWWHSNRNKMLVSLALGAPVAVWFLAQFPAALAHTLLEYAAFIALLSALFLIAGGIYIRGSFTGKPLTNLGFYVVGAVLANLIGTTGASMLLIRPLLRANHRRRHKAHIVVFFIFIVSNCAGLLTPLGDPPLYLGFLKGVPFSWPLRLWPQWLFMVGVLLGVFYLTDRALAKREERAEHITLGSATPSGTTGPPGTPGGQPARGVGSASATRSDQSFGVEGLHNFVFLAMVLGLVLFSGSVVYPMRGPSLLGDSFGSVLSKLVQTAGMAVIAGVSYAVTRKDVRRKNDFTFAPMLEVAVVFAGIFLTMGPALLILESRGGDLGLDRAWQYFWATGVLSSFLDNAPTYLAFTSLVKGTLGLHGEGLQGLVADPSGAAFLAAISTGAVFMGANTYIGNGPNFMVRAVAEQAGVRMPTFIGYMAWSAAILAPLYVLLSLLFFR
jgi:Na+/H+ antiporter NhaD/arsenite permease-like protein